MALKTQTGQAAAKKQNFHQELVLNRWALGFFQGGTLAALKLRLGDDRFEGIDEDGQTKFFHELTRGLFDPNKVPEAELRRYDLNIVTHWQAITEQRNKLEGHALQMKYFQYLSLLLTELYLDWYFNRRQALLDGLNEEMGRYRAEADEVFDTVVSAIPAFRDAEPGSIESITRTVDEFLDEYNLDIEMLEDKAGEDLDGDSEVGEDEAHAETITTSPEPIYTDPFESLDKDTDTGYTDPDSALFT
jgi:hypothetical protein